MENKKEYAVKLIESLAKKLEVDISGFDMNEMLMGMAVELEHGSIDEKTNVTDDNPEQTFKIMIAHLKEVKDYYTKLKKYVEPDSKEVPVDDKEGKEDEKLEDTEAEEKEELNEGMSTRFKELCGIKENESKKQLKNESFQEKKQLLKEQVSEEDFKIEEFENDGTGSEKDNKDLYKIEKLKKQTLNEGK